MSIKSEKFIIDLSLAEVAKRAIEEIHEEIARLATTPHSWTVERIIRETVSKYVPKKTMLERGLICSVVTVGSTAVFPVKTIRIEWKLRKGHPYYSELFPDKDQRGYIHLFNVSYARELMGKGSCVYKLKNLTFDDASYAKKRTIQQLIDAQVSWQIKRTLTYRNAALSLLSYCKEMPDYQLKGIMDAAKTLYDGHLNTYIRNDGEWVTPDWGKKEWLEKLLGSDRRKKILQSVCDGARVAPAGVTEDVLKEEFTPW